jgi:hypothetical protein
MRRVKTESLPWSWEIIPSVSVEGGLILMTVGQQAIDELAIRTVKSAADELRFLVLRTGLYKKKTAMNRNSGARRYNQS